MFTYCSNYAILSKIRIEGDVLKPKNLSNQNDETELEKITSVISFTVVFDNETDAWWPASITNTVCEER